MNELNYQRMVAGYHGCDRRTRDRILRGKAAWLPSLNTYDWLGHGIYFWEYGPERALQWAKQQARAGRIKQPAVIGAWIHLGNCFDLLDSAFTDVLSRSYQPFCQSLAAAGKEIPKNKPLHLEDNDRLLRELDCGMINWTIEQVEKSAAGRYQTVRGMFQEGGAAYPESGIHKLSHIQIAVRDVRCIVGCFLPF